MVTGDYRGLQRDTVDYKGLNDVTRVTVGYKKLQEVKRRKRGYKRLLGVTGGL